MDGLNVSECSEVTSSFVILALFFPASCRPFNLLDLYSLFRSPHNFVPMTRGPSVLSMKSGILSAPARRRAHRHKGQGRDRLAVVPRTSLSVRYCSMCRTICLFLTVNRQAMTNSSHLITIFLVGRTAILICQKRLYGLFIRRPVSGEPRALIGSQPGGYGVAATNFGTCDGIVPVQGKFCYAKPYMRRIWRLFAAVSVPI